VPAGFIFITAYFDHLFEPPVLYSGSLVLDLYHAQKGRPLASEFNLSIFSPSHEDVSLALLFTGRAKTFLCLAGLSARTGFCCLKFFIIND
jgi:hypothetical protein